MTQPAGAVMRTDDAATETDFTQSWRTPNSDRPVLVKIEVSLDSSGTNEARIEVDADDTGDQFAEYKLIEELPSGLSTTDERQIVCYIAAGGNYRIRNAADPDSSNAINMIREFTL